MFDPQHSSKYLLIQKPIVTVCKRTDFGGLLWCYWNIALHPDQPNTASLWNPIGSQGKFSGNLFENNPLLSPFSLLLLEAQTSHSDRKEHDMKSFWLLHEYPSSVQFLIQCLRKVHFPDLCTVYLSHRLVCLSLSRLSTVSVILCMSILDHLFCPPKTESLSFWQ